MTQNFANLISNPQAEVMAAKRGANVGKAAAVLAAASALFAVATAILLATAGGAAVSLATALMAGGVFVLVMVGGLFLGLVVRTIAVTLGGKGDYAEGLTAVAYAGFAPAAGAVVASAATLVPVAGSAISFAVLALALAAGVSTFYRSIKELFSTDMVTAFVTVSIFALVIGMAFWGTIMTTLAGQLLTTGGLGGLLGVPGV